VRRGYARSVSARARVRLIVVAIALAAAGLAAGVAALSRGDSTAAPQAPPLELGITLAATQTDRDLIAAEGSYDRGNRELALRRFQDVLDRDPGSVEAQVGAAVAAWPKGTAQRLRAIVGEHPASAVARLHLGLALSADGDESAAVTEWRAAKKSDPDSPSAVRAEDLLHPEMPPGRPFYLLADAPEGGDLAALAPGEQLAELERRAEEGAVADWLLYGSVLQRLGRPVAAREAFDRAVALDPASVEAQTAAAVARFDKDDPAAAFSRLGPLARSHPDAPVVRFHLGFMLLWLNELDEARRQLGLAEEAGPATVYGQEARRLLERLDEG
jgi:tetratricopeptide (TPR) repeat protein